MVTGGKISYFLFLPFSEEVRKGNRLDMSWPSPEWLHGRLEGQTFLVKTSNFIKDMLVEEGHQGLIPIIDSRFRSGGMTGLTAGQGEMGLPVIGPKDMLPMFAVWVLSVYLKG